VINRSNFDKTHFEEEFIKHLYKVTEGKMASIFVDNIGEKRKTNDEVII